MGATTWPKGISPKDWSREACQRRVAHYEAMYALNPKGFRQPSDKSIKTKSRVKYTRPRVMSEIAYG